MALVERPLQKHPSRKCEFEMGVTKNRRLFLVGNKKKTAPQPLLMVDPVMRSTTRQTCLAITREGGEGEGGGGGKGEVRYQGKKRRRNGSNTKKATLCIVLSGSKLRD